MYPGSLSRVLAGRQKLGRLHAEHLAGVLGYDVQHVLEAAGRVEPVPAERPGPPWRHIIDEALAARQITISEFADTAGISRTAVYDVLRGARNLTPLIARHLVEQLDVDLPTLLRAIGVDIVDGLAGQLLLQRWRRGWSRAQLRCMAGTTEVMIAKIEQGVMPRRPDPLLRVCAALGVEVPETGPTPFARALRARLHHKKMTVTQLAQAVGVSPLAAAQWLSGAHPRPQKMAALTAALGDPDQRLLQEWQQHRQQLPRPTGRRADGMPRGWPRTVSGTAGR